MRRAGSRGQDPQRHQDPVVGYDGRSRPWRVARPHEGTAMSTALSKSTCKPRRGRRPIAPYRDRGDQIARICQARREGATLESAAKLVGVHVATLHRWQARDNAIWELLHDAEQYASRQRCMARPRCRPRVASRRDCPLCGGPIRVRAVRYEVRIWCCSRCRWRSWRPRHPQNCECGAAQFWSGSRASFACSACRKRTFMGDRG
jgi:hypothetical protein